MSRVVLLIAGAVALACVPLACAKSNDDAAGGASSANGGAGGGSTVSSTGGLANTSESVSSSATGIGGGCAGTSTKAIPLPLDIFVMLDQSGSMNLDAGNNLSRWQSIKAALTSFVQEPSSAGIGMGIQYFGLPQPLIPGCTAMHCTLDTDCTGGCGPCAPQGICLGPFNPDIDSCDAVDYAWADVAIAPLPGSGNALISSIGAHSPGTNTPTAPALAGAIDYASSWATAHPTHITVVAFATDGEPSECDLDMNNINATAAAGFAATPSIRTFVVGVGPALSALDGIAAAGGTTTAFHVDLNTMATDQFLDALNVIRGVAIGCTYLIPPPPMGMQEDFNLVNVTYTPGNGSPQTLPKVADAASCPATGDAWYYDDNANPTHIILCSSTCTTVSHDIMAEIDIVLGCQTIVN